MAVADFDRDGLPDLATADTNSNRVTVLRNDGDGTFSTLATRRAVGHRHTNRACHCERVTRVHT